MATSKILLSGMAKWVKNLKPDTKFPPAAFKMNLYPDKASIKIYEDSGARLKFREDEDGKFITLRRVVEKDFGDEVKQYGPPKTFLKGKEEDFTGLIGNGSIVTAQLSVFDTKTYGKGTRWEALRIDKLVEYVSTSEEPETKGIPF